MLETHWGFPLVSVLIWVTALFMYAFASAFIALRREQLLIGWWVFSGPVLAFLLAMRIQAVAPMTPLRWLAGSAILILLTTSGSVWFISRRRRKRPDTALWRLTFSGFAGAVIGACMMLGVFLIQDIARL